MKLYLVQHGEALAKDVDPDRPLSPQGGKDVQKIAHFLRRAGISVDNILHSGKMRAHQSADILAGALLERGDVQTVDGIGPNDPVEAFSETIHALKEDTMLVGHLPFMARMVSYLVGGRSELQIVAYEPGSVVCLARDEERHWRIEWMLRPNLLGR